MKKKILYYTIFAVTLISCILAVSFLMAFIQTFYKAKLEPALMYLFYGIGLGLCAFIMRIVKSKLNIKS